jgi:Pyridoxamine 5'-phosphate oxidase
MSRFVGEQLPDALLSRFSRDRAVELADRAIVICTVDEHGWPHPAMVSSLELVATDARNIRLMMHSASRSVRNMRASGRVTLIVVDDDRAYYLKGDVVLVTPSLGSAPDHAGFNLRIDSVLEDNPAEYEQARIVSSIRVERNFDQALARTRIDELARD